MKILFTGGGTAGHIYPIVAIAREIRKNSSGEKIEFFYIGPKDKFVSTLFLREGIKVNTIISGKIRRYFSFQNIIDILFKIPIGLLQSFFYIFIISPDVIFSKGGYGSFPAVLAGKILLTPIFLHESDASPGLANKIAGRLALEIFVSFPVKKMEEFPPEKMIYLGNITRKNLLNGSKENAKKIFNLTGEKPLILALGGSQGAKIINDKLLLILPEFLKDFELIHQTGKNNFEEVKMESEAIIAKELGRYYHPYPFLNEEELADAYSAADLIVSRAGAGSIFEIAAIAKPSILIPLANSAQNHQVKNAYIYAENGSAMIIEEANFTPHFFLERIKYLFNSPDEMKKMAEKAKEFSTPDSARIIAEYLISYLSQDISSNIASKK